MKSRPHIKIAVVGILLLPILVFSSREAEDVFAKERMITQNEIIEKNVRTSLEESEEIAVIILLKEPEGLRKKPADIIKGTIRQIQDKFLLNFTDDDFKLTHRNEMTPILMGELSRSGLKKVEKMLNMVRSIKVPRPVKALWLITKER
jgi:hypothetical protein